MAAVAPLLSSVPVCWEAWWVQSSTGSPWMSDWSRNHWIIPPWPVLTCAFQMVAVSADRARWTCTVSFSTSAEPNGTKNNRKDASGGAGRQTMDRGKEHAFWHECNCYPTRKGLEPVCLSAPRFILIKLKCVPRRLKKGVSYSNVSLQKNIQSAFFDHYNKTFISTWGKLLYLLFQTVCVRYPPGKLLHTASVVMHIKCLFRGEKKKKERRRSRWLEVEAPAEKIKTTAPTETEAKQKLKATIIR